MAKLTPQQINEVNAVIAEISKAVTPTSEIGACDKPTLSGLLSSHGIEKEASFFKCRRELSNDIVSFFTKEKGVAKSRFDRHAQTHIFVIEQSSGVSSPRPPAAESGKAAPKPKAESPAPKKEAVKKEAPAKKAPAKAAAKKSAPAKAAKPAKKVAAKAAKGKKK
jgi:pyruvate/2-oxoglutarate dehydrogenase complex dihydrolipoamide acyltransferase (E2) component